MITTQVASADSPNIASLRDSAIEAALIQEVHVYGGTEYHIACAGNHNWRKRQDASGRWVWVYNSPCVWIWRPWKRRESPN
jgi:hypothetical protein